MYLFICSAKNFLQQMLFLTFLFECIYVHKKSASQRELLFFYEVGFLITVYGLGTYII
jgi:hypothetical protein